MIDRVGRSEIRFQARERIKYRYTDILFYSLYFTVATLAIYLIGQDFQIFGISLALFSTIFASYFCWSNKIINLKIFRNENILFSDTFYVLQKDKFQKNVLSFIIIFIIQILSMIPQYLLIAIFWSMYNDRLQNINFLSIAYFKPDMLIEQIAHLLRVLAIQIIIFAVILTIIYIAIFFLLLFKEFVCFVIYDVRDDAKIIDIFRLSFKIIKGHRVSYVLNILNIVFKILLSYLLFGIILFLCISTDLYGIFILCVVTLTILNFILVYYANLSIAGFYDKALRELENDEMIRCFIKPDVFGNDDYEQLSIEE